MERLRAVLWMAIALLLAACGEAPQVPMRVGTNVWPGYEPLYLARDLAYIDQQSVRLVEYSSASQVIRAYRNGAIDAAALTLDEVLLLAQDDLEPRVVLVMDVSHGGDVIVGQSGLQSMADLKGKRVGFEDTALGAYVLARALEQAHMTVAMVHKVSVEVDEHERAFRAGRVDAVVTFEPVRSRLLNDGATLLFDSSRIPGEVVDVLIVSKRFLQTHKTQVQALLSAWFQALHYLQSEPTDAARRIAQRLRLEPQEVLQSYDGLQLPDRSENLRLLGGADQDAQLLQSASRLMEVMRAGGLLRKPVDVEQLFSAPVL